MHLREGEDEFLSGWKLRQTVRKYSDHIALPILMRKEVWDPDKQAYRVTGPEIMKFTKSR